MMETARILVTGSRNWTDRETIYEALVLAWHDMPIGKIRGPGTLLVHGACPNGADALADQIWREVGLPVEPHPARWSDGPTAGFERNAEMVALGADLCLAFHMPCAKRGCPRMVPHVSHGSEHCAALAERSGIPVRRFYG